MPKSSHPRKAYKARFVRQTPVTCSLYNEFDLQLMVCIEALWQGPPRKLAGPIAHKTDWAADMVAKMINLINTAQHRTARPDMRITGSVSVVQRWLDSYVATGTFYAREHDLQTVSVAIQAAREYLATASVERLYDAKEILKTFETLEGQHAFSSAHGRRFEIHTAAGAPTQAHDAHPNQDRPAASDAGVPQGFGSAPSGLATQPRDTQKTALQAL